MIVVINGFPRSGKSTFVELCKKVAHTGWVQEHSTVDFVKWIAKKCGWDGTKDARNRKFLSDLKDLLTEWGDVPFLESCKEIGLMYADADRIGTEPENLVMFIHCREPHEIQKFVDRYGEGQCRTLLIRRPAVEGNDQSNHADQQVLDYQYHTVIVNDGTLEELEQQAIEYLTKLMGGKILK